MKPSPPEKRPANQSVADMLAEIRGPKVRPEVLLAEFDALLRTRPSMTMILDGKDEALAWLGAVAAALGHWDRSAKLKLTLLESDLHNQFLDHCEPAYKKLVALLNEARHSLRMTTDSAGSVAVESGKVFEYFDELRKIVEGATADLLFVDPYLDADFVSRYLPFVPQGVAIRLLAGDKKLATLLPAVDAFAKQAGVAVPVRSTDKIHDRYVFVDRKECFQSGASFKDGAAKAPTTITQIRDAFDAMAQTYEALWNAGKVQR